MPNHDAYPMTHSIPASKHKTAEDEQTLEKWLREYYPYIHRLAASILDDAHEADDVAQETFIAAHRSLVGFRHDSDPKTWLTSIALNASRGRLRKRKIRQILNQTMQTLHITKNTPASPEQTVIQSESEQNVWKAVDELDEKHRLPIILRYVHELSVSDIARALHISQGTVHSRLHYARRQLFNRLDRLDQNQELYDEKRS
jgi:RNA polymerase sigma-70 factor, ECF subfamily